jgi:hypothetical protein
MNSGRNDRQRISRRVVLTGTALALGATATVVSQTAAQVKISAATANYQDTPKGDQRCAGCANFQPPNACKFVEGHRAGPGNLHSAISGVSA